MELITARPTPRVLSMVAEKGGLDGCYMWRVLQPAAELDRQGYRGIGWDYFNNPLMEYVWHAYDAIVIPRLSWEDEDIEAEARWFNLVQSAGKTVIYEVDDDLFSDSFVQRLIATHDKTPERAENVRSGLVRALRRCDGVTVSSEYLGVIVRDLTDRPVRVVPNFIDLRWFRGMKRANKRWIPPLTIGWAGGLRPDTDVEQMAIAWGRIADRFPAVNFVVQGHQPAVLHDNVPPDRIHALPWMSIQEYPAGIANIDIGCCPLAPQPFNRAKTYIKAMEYAAMGAAVVASPTVYQQLVDDGVNGYICETADQWEQALIRLVSDATHRREMAAALLAKIRGGYTLERNAWRWLVAWDEIIEETRQRRERPAVYLPQRMAL